MVNIINKNKQDEILSIRGWDTFLKFRKTEWEWDKFDAVVSLFNHWLNDKTNFLILYDVDVDGLFSGYFIDNYLRRLGKNTFTMINKEKAHGLNYNFNEKLEFITDNNIEVIIIPDAGSNDKVELEHLSRLGVKVLVLDHHDIEDDLYDSENVKILNFNEEEFLPKLSGAGVTYRFIEKLNTEFNKGLDIKIYEDLVGITVLSDACDMSDNENRYYVKELYDNYNKYKLFGYFDYYGSDASLMQYKVIPFLNALIRLGLEETAVKIVNGLNDDKVLKYYVRDKIFMIKTRQKDLIDDVRRQGKILNTDNFVVHLRKTDYGKTVNGLLANMLMNEYNKSGLVLVMDDNNVIKGSFRGINFNNNVLKRNGIVCKGHDLACGVFMDKGILTKFINSYQFKEDDLLGEDLNHYDIEIPEMELDKKYVRKMAVFNEFSGKGVKPIRIKLKNPNIFIRDVIHNTNYTDIIIGNHVIKDFTNKEVDELIVEPTFNKEKGSYSLIRV